MTPNTAQIESMIRLLLGAGGPLAAMLVNKGMSASTVNEIMTLALAIVPPLISLVWGLFRHTDNQTVKAASQVNGVSKIQVSPYATGGALKAAQDPTLENVEYSK